MQLLDSKGMGERIRKRREELNISREHLAEELDVSVKFISDIECGMRGVSLKRLMILSVVLLIPTDYILFGNDVTSDQVFLHLIEKCPNNKRGYLLEIIRKVIESYE